MKLCAVILIAQTFSLPMTSVGSAIQLLWVQWNPSITATLGEKHFAHYNYRGGLYWGVVLYTNWAGTWPLYRVGLYSGVMIIMMSTCTCLHACMCMHACACHYNCIVHSILTGCNKSLNLTDNNGDPALFCLATRNMRAECQPRRSQVNK